MACDLLSQAFAAVQAGDLASLRTALDQPGSPALTLQDDSGHSLLQVAASAGQSEVVQELVARGANPAEVDCEQIRSNPAIASILFPQQPHSNGEGTPGTPSTPGIPGLPPMGMPLPGPGYFYPPPNGDFVPPTPFVGPDGMMIPPHHLPPPPHLHHPMNGGPQQVGSLPPPEVARTIPCRFFPQCRYGDQCVFFHPSTRANVPPTDQPHEGSAPGTPLNYSSGAPGAGALNGMMFYPPPPPFGYFPPPGGAPVPPPGPGQQFYMPPPMMGYAPPPPPPHAAPRPVPTSLPAAPAPTAPTAPIIPFLPPAPAPVQSSPATASTTATSTAPVAASAALTAVKADAAPFEPSGLVPRLGAPMHLPLGYTPRKPQRTHHANGSKPKRSGPMPACRYFPSGACNKGDQCPFPHLLPDGTDVSGRKRSPRTAKKEEVVGDAGDKPTTEANEEKVGSTKSSSSRPRYRRSFKVQPSLSQADFPALGGTAVASTSTTPSLAVGTENREPKVNFSAIVSASAEKAEEAKDVPKPKVEPKIELKPDPKHPEAKHHLNGQAKLNGESKVTETETEIESKDKVEKVETVQTNDKKHDTKGSAIEPATTEYSTRQPQYLPTNTNPEDDFTLVKRANKRGGPVSSGLGGRTAGRGERPSFHGKSGSKPTALTA